MAEINIERKTSVWPWIIAVIVTGLLLWALFATMGGSDTDNTATAPAANGALQTAPDVNGTTPDSRASTTRPNTDANRPPAAATAAEQRDAALDRHAGTYGSGNHQLVLSSAGSYTMRDTSTTGETWGRWSIDAGAGLLQLTSADGSEVRNYRVEGLDTLTPLASENDPGAQMAPLQRAVEQ